MAFNTLSKFEIIINKDTAIPIIMKTRLSASVKSLDFDLGLEDSDLRTAT